MYNCIILYCHMINIYHNKYIIFYIYYIINFFPRYSCIKVNIYNRTISFKTPLIITYYSITILPYVRRRRPGMLPQHILESRVLNNGVPLENL